MASRFSGLSPLGVSEDAHQSTKRSGERGEEGGGGGGGGSKKMVTCVVNILDGCLLRLPCERKAKAGDLVESVLSELGLEEKDFFSLYYTDNEQRVFLNPMRSVQDQIGQGKHSNVWEVRFGVKFYVSDPEELEDEEARHFFCYQVCQDIREGRITPMYPVAVKLMALMIQGHLGDYDDSEHTLGYFDDLTLFQLVPSNHQPPTFQQDVMDAHKQLRGLVPSVADSKFLKLAKQQGRYGMHLFTTRTEEQDPGVLGVSFRGLTVYRDGEEKGAYHWKELIKLSYRRRFFKIKYRPTKQSAGVVVRVYTAAGRVWPKRMWRCAVEHHTFFRRKEPEKPTRMESFFRRGSKFRYSGRTLKQIQDVRNSKRLSVRSEGTSSTSKAESPRQADPSSNKPKGRPASETSPVPPMEQQISPLGIGEWGEGLIAEQVGLFLQKERTIMQFVFNTEEKGEEGEGEGAAGETKDVTPESKRLDPEVSSDDAPPKRDDASPKTEESSPEVEEEEEEEESGPKPLAPEVEDVDSDNRSPETNPDSDSPDLESPGHKSPDHKSDIPDHDSPASDHDSPDRASSDRESSSERCEHPDDAPPPGDTHQEQEGGGEETTQPGAASSSETQLPDTQQADDDSA